MHVMTPVGAKDAGPPRTRRPPDAVARPPFALIPHRPASARPRPLPGASFCRLRPGVPPDPAGPWLPSGSFLSRLPRAPSTQPHPALNASPAYAANYCVSVFAFHLKHKLLEEREWVSFIPEFPVLIRGMERNEYLD